MTRIPNKPCIGEIAAIIRFVGDCGHIVLRRGEQRQVRVIFAEFRGNVPDIRLDLQGLEWHRASPALHAIVSDHGVNSLKINGLISEVLPIDFTKCLIFQCFPFLL